MTPLEQAREALQALADAFMAHTRWNGDPPSEVTNARNLVDALSAQEVPAGEPVPCIDPMQDPMRPGYFMNYAEDETPAEMVLRKLACWLGVGGYNAPTVDAEQFHRKIVDGVESLLRTAAPAAPKQGWQPIETAPKDGTTVLFFRLLHGRPSIESARWKPQAEAFGGDGWSYAPGRDGPTHWMPLPSAPAAPRG